MPFDTKSYIDHLAEELVRNFDYASNATTPVLVGSAKEKEVIRKLELLLPNSVAIGSGCIIDSYGNTSKQMDIVIYEKEFCPIFSINSSPETTYYPCEGVIAVGEVKSSLSTKELKNIFDKSKSVKKLVRYSVSKKSELSGDQQFAHRSYNSRISFEGYGSEHFDQKNKILDQIFFFSLCGKLDIQSNTLIKKFGENLNKCSDGEEVNLISILKDGLLIFRNKKNNNIVMSKKDADSFCFFNQNNNNFQFLLKMIMSFITNGRTVPVGAFNRYLDTQESLYLLEGINTTTIDLQSFESNKF